MKRIDMTNVQEATDSKRLPAGAYICVIRNAEDIPDKDYLKITYDIADGEFKGYYDELRGNHPDWAWVGAYVKSYKNAALPMFKRFCTSISKSNGSFVFDGGSINADERTLIGKRLGIMLREEEYYKNDGDIGTRLIVFKEFPVNDLQNQKTPPKKELPPQKEDANGFVPINNSSDKEEIPF